MRRSASDRPTPDWIDLGVCGAYVVAAGLLGWQADYLEVFGRGLAPMSSASATAILTSIASGMMALTGIVFSLVFVALQFGTSTYSPRQVWEFGQHRLLPNALGVFTGTFIYALLATRTIDRADSPGVNVSVVMLALLWLSASVLMLVLIVPRVRGMGVNGVLEALGRRGRRALAEVYSDRSGEQIAGEDDPGAPPPPLPTTQEIRHVGGPRYLTRLDVRALVKLAKQVDGMFYLPLAPGDPVIAGDRLVTVLGGSGQVSERQIRRHIKFGVYRSMETDPAYSLRMLVDIAIRALSPAVNDPTTAVNALDQIDSLLRDFGNSRLDVGRYTDEEGVLRLLHNAPRWSDLLALALSEITHYGADATQVQRRLGALLRDLLELLPKRRHAAIQVYLERRKQVLRAAFPLDSESGEAGGRDRQGLGHGVMGDEFQS